MTAEDYSKQTREIYTKLEENGATNIDVQKPGYGPNPDVEFDYEDVHMVINSVTTGVGRTFKVDIVDRNSEMSLGAAVVGARALEDLQEGEGARHFGDYESQVDQDVPSRDLTAFRDSTGPGSSKITVESVETVLDESGYTHLEVYDMDNDIDPVETVLDFADMPHEGQSSDSGILRSFGLGTEDEDTRGFWEEV